MDDKLVQETGCDYCKTCGRSREEKRQSDFQQHPGRSASADYKLNINAESVSKRHRGMKKVKVHFIFQLRRAKN